MYSCFLLRILAKKVSIFFNFISYGVDSFIFCLVSFTSILIKRLQILLVFAHILIYHTVSLAIVRVFYKVVN